jgi:organic radical activating enzyme
MFEKKNSFFPIKQKPACQWKWTWSTLWLSEGMTTSCHRCKKIPLDKENFDNFHNLPHKINERKLMLEGKWPTVENGGSGHCMFCKSVEDSGGISDRMTQLQVPNLTPDELSDDPTATSVTPKILEIFMNSTCNLKCSYCNTHDSSQWKAEVQKHGVLKHLDGSLMQGYGDVKNHPDQRYFFEKTLDWLKRNGHKLRRLHLLGGETFYQSELQEMLDVLKFIKNKHLEFNIVSNLFVKENIFLNYIEQIKKLCKDKNIGRFDLTTSIDGWGEEQEYARYPIKMDIWKKLFEHAVNERWIYLNINQTISSLTLRHQHKLIEYINTFRKIRPINQHQSFVNNRWWMHPDIFGFDFWKEAVENTLKVMPEDSPMNIRSKKYMEGKLYSIPKNLPDKNKIKTLHYFLDQLDKRRNTNWRNVFPHLNIST